MWLKVPLRLRQLHAQPDASLKRNAKKDYFSETRLQAICRLTRQPLEPRPCLGEERETCFGAQTRVLCHVFSRWRWREGHEAVLERCQRQISEWSPEASQQNCGKTQGVNKEFKKPGISHAATKTKNRCLQDPKQLSFGEVLKMSDKARFACLAKRCMFGQESAAP